MVGKKLGRRLAALGAAPLLERGLGDDRHPSGYEASLDPWLQAMWPVLRNHFPLPDGVSEVGIHSLIDQSLIEQSAVSRVEAVEQQTYPYTRGRSCACPCSQRQVMLGPG